MNESTSPLPPSPLEVNYVHFLYPFPAAASSLALKTRIRWSISGVNPGIADGRTMMVG